MGDLTKRQLLESIMAQFGVPWGSLTIHAQDGKVTHTEERRTDKALDQPVRRSA